MAGFIIAAVLASMLLVTGCRAASHMGDSGRYRRISADEAMDIMEGDEDHILLDVRTEAEFAALHIPGAICIPVEGIPEKAPERLPDQEQLILVYCRSGYRSERAARELVEMGYKSVLDFGGIGSWPGETTSDL